MVTANQKRWLRRKVAELIGQGGIDHRRLGGREGVTAALLDLRAHIIPEWIEELATEIAAHEATLVGFTCMFDQTLASVALARRIRRWLPTRCALWGATR